MSPARRLFPVPGLALALGVTLIGLLSCNGAEAVGARAGDLTRRVRVFLISPGDGGGAGRQVACGDSAVPVEVNLDRTTPALWGSLEALLALDARYHGPSGLYNPLYASPLRLEGIDLDGASARVRLGGYLESGDRCDDPRILAQLTETALQFPEVEHVQFYLEGKPLPELIATEGRLR